MTSHQRRARGRVGLVLIALVCSLTACAPPSSTSEGTIALLLPDSDTARYETFDRPEFEARVAELGDYRVLYSNADQDAGKQQQQSESALASGADVLVLDAVDGKAAAGIVAEATAQGVPVIAYDRFISDAPLAYFVSFDGEEVGRLQGEALAEAVADAPVGAGILMVNGSPTDSNAADYKHGARTAIDAAGIPVLADFDTPGWSPAKAQEWVAGQIARFGDRIAGIYAANDGLAGGAIAALSAADVTDPPPVTGQDADLAAIQRIVSGTQHMTVYKAIKPQARLAADAAVALLNGDQVEAETVVGDVPTTLLQPVGVTVDRIMDTVVADGFWTVDDICTAPYAAACTSAGIG